ncbi:hypothetical protein AB205_0155600 [Aquarana catesbeiana]|uniref:C2H2-type domain-containing protein n=1 Tax=Aquarana catesbeiana TaxID=8400 RepID=A0A2G9RJR7_AQUCT|nr:hypothetical protein AB205_0155600 [Aquarana catesbeiana]
MRRYCTPYERSISIPQYKIMFLTNKDPPGGNPNTQNIHHRPPCPETSMDPSDQGESSHQSHIVSADVHVRFHTADKSSDPSNPKETSLPLEGVHRHEKLFSCSECGKCFSNKGNLNKHKRIHTEYRKSFAKKGNLPEHQRSHTRECPYLCSECGKSFTMNEDLVKHQRIHTSEHNYSCSESGKCITEEKVPLRHKKINFGEGPYSGTENFFNKGNLFKHQKKCGKSFAQKTLLNRHKTIHTGSISIQV